MYVHNETSCLPEVNAPPPYSSAVYPMHACPLWRRPVGIYITATNMMSFSSTVPCCTGCLSSCVTIQWWVGTLDG